MNVIDMSIDQIIPYQNNPRNNENAVEKVAESIKRFGFKVPIIIDRDNVIVAGHTRLLAANKLGLKTVPCIIADDLTPEQVKAFRLADNKVSEFSTWDFEKLELEMSEINLDMEIFGFDSIEDIDCNDNEVIEDDFLPDIPEEPKAKLGDVYQLGNHRLMCGNSTSASDIGKLLNGAHMHLFLSDPPYGINVVQRSKICGGKAFGKVGGGKIVNSNNYMSIKGDDSTETARENYDIVSQITDNQIIFGGNYFTDFLPPRACWCIWDKENTGNFADVEMAWTSFNKGAKLYHWLWNGLCRKGDRATEGIERVHPTQKPVGLLVDILKDFSSENDNILDCFGGSGSTLIACEQLNRQCYMMEYEPHYVDVIIERWEQFTGKKAVLLSGNIEENRVVCG